MSTTTTTARRIGTVMSMNSNDLIMKTSPTNNNNNNAAAAEEAKNVMGESNQADKANESMKKAPNPHRRPQLADKSPGGGDRSLTLQLKRTILSRLSAHSKSARRRIYRQLDSILSDLLDKRSATTRSAGLVQSISTSSTQALNDHSTTADKRITAELNSIDELEFQEANPNFTPVKPVRVNVQSMSAKSVPVPVVKSVKGVKRPLMSDGGGDETDSHSLNKRLCAERAAKPQLETRYESVFNNELTEKQLWIITNNYENLSDWKRICLTLGLTAQDVQCIESQYLQYEGLKECFYQSLLRWRMREPENCYLAYFNQVLAFRLGVDSRQTSRLANELTKGQESEREQPGRDPTPPLSQKQLWTASGLLSKDWKEIARSCLDLNESDICSIERVHLASEGPRECSYQSLLLWSESCSRPSASLSVLCSKLAEHKFKLYARQLLNLLSPTSS